MELIHYHFDTLISTNDWAKANLDTLPRDQITLVSTTEQTGGRGQYGRKWISPKGKNLYASFCFFVDKEQQDPLSLTHVLAISASRVLGSIGVICKIKWPNDLLVKGEKIAGILCETKPFPFHSGVVIGIGMNINMENELLDQIDQPATSLQKETGRSYPIEEVLEQVQKAFVHDLEVYLQEGFAPFASTFQSLVL